MSYSENIWRVKNDFFFSNGAGEESMRSHLVLFVVFVSDISQDEVHPYSYYVKSGQHYCILKKLIIIIRGAQLTGGSDSGRVDT